MPAAGGHGAGARIGQGFVHCLQPRDLLPDATISAGQMQHFPGAGLARFLSIEADHLVDTAFDVGFQTGEAAGDLVPGEVAIPVVDGFELAAADGNLIALQLADPAAQFHELRAGLADRASIRAAEFGGGFVVRHQPADQPHQLDIAPGFTLRPGAGWDPVQRAIDEQLQQSGRMIPWPAGACRGRALEAEVCQIRLIDEQIKGADKIIFADPVFQSLGKSTIWPR